MGILWQLFMFEDSANLGESAFVKSIGLKLLRSNQAQRNIPVDSPVLTDRVSSDARARVSATMQKDFTEKEKKENVERLRQLRFEEIVITPERPVEKCLEEPLKIYDENTIPDETFVHLSEGNFRMFYEMILQKRGGMMNRANPRPEELVRYLQHDPNFHSVKEQMTLDLQGKSGTPGKYRLFSFRDPSGKMIAWLSCRLPDGKTDEAYNAYLEEQLVDKLRFESSNDREKWPVRFRKCFPNVMEWDTINTRPGYKGLADLMLARTMGQIERDTPRERVPQMIYFYRFGDLEPIEPPAAVDYPFGHNEKTAKLVNRMGFTEMASRKDEIVVRKIDGVEMPIVCSMKRRYSSGLWNEMVKKSLEMSLSNLGLKQKEIFGE